MSRDEVKDEINNELDLLPNKALEDLLSFLKNSEGKSSSSMLGNGAFEKVLSEDNELLEKLGK
jgi:hypothetical protein